MRAAAHAVSRAALMFCLMAMLVCLVHSTVTAQQKGGAADSRKLPAPAAPPQLKRTTTRTQLLRLGYGGMFTIFGAPEGSITIEAWQRSEVEISADIEWQGDTEEDLSLLASVNNFVVDDDLNHIRIITHGTHDRRYMKQLAREVPKRLLTLPWKIAYRVRVPIATDLEIFAGRGPLSIEGIEGAVRLNAGESAATLALTGGDVEATFERGNVRLRVPARSWRGRGANVRLASGDLTVELPANFNGDINAEVLRTGSIENSYAGLALRDGTHANARSLQGRAGSGGATLSFTVGDGTLHIKQESSAAP